VTSCGVFVRFRAPLQVKYHLAFDTSSCYYGICFTIGATLFYILHLLCFVASLLASVVFYKLIELPTQN
jgi:hypothetical protein